MRNVLLITVLSSEKSDSTGITKILDFFNQGSVGSVAQFIDNINTLFTVILFVGILIFFLVTFRNRTKKLSKTLLNLLSKNGKYIRHILDTQVVAIAH